MRGRALAAALLLAAASPAAAQQPRITNAQIAPAPAGASFTATFEGLVGGAADVTWIGYAVPSARPDAMSCCFSSGDMVISGTVVMRDDGRQWTSGCRMEPAIDGQSPSRAGSAGEPPAQAPAPRGLIKLEGSTHAVVLFRVVDRQVERVRTFSDACDLDAGGRAVRWMDTVRPAESAALLEGLIRRAERRDRVVNGALAALAMHAAVEASEALIRLARQHEAAPIRGEAIFWLGQKAGEQAAGEITARIEQDPDTEVKRRAVFALSQLPKDEGVPLLIRVARTNPNPAVKKQAIFWLGQSKDPRALEYFAEILR
jgi:hypothetical protein